MDSLSDLFKRLSCYSFSSLDSLSSNLPTTLELYSRSSAYRSDKRPSYLLKEKQWN